jgi:hypothetical protein
MDLEKHIFKDKEFISVVKKAITFFQGTPLHPLPLSDSFNGSGVYALYYLGNFELYKKLSAINKKGCSKPIYVGKAVPPGWRTARNSNSIDTNRVLFNRIREHGKSIDQVNNLSINDFRVRFMIITGLEIDLVVPVESELIRSFCPLWNNAIDGFGNHDPGNGRYEQAVSEWDALHPGRSWVSRLKGNVPNVEEIKRKVKTLL